MAESRVFAVIGLGSFGRRVCEVLSDRGMTVVAMDNNPALVDKISEVVARAQRLDTTDPDQLSQASLEDVDVGVVAIGENIEASILTTALLKQFGVPYIFARAVSDIHYHVLRRIGAHEVLNIEIDQGERVAQRLIAPDVLDQIPISEDISIAEVFVPEGFVGKTLSRLDLRNKFRITVVSIRRVQITVTESGTTERSEEVLFPVAQTNLRKNDTLIVVGKNDDIANLRRYAPGGS